MFLLGRTATEQTTYGSIKTSSYDLAGRRPRLSWQDSMYVDYDYDVTGHRTAMRELSYEFHDFPYTARPISRQSCSAVA